MKQVDCIPFGGNTALGAGFLDDDTKVFWTGRQMSKEEAEKLENIHFIYSMAEVEKLFDVDIPDELKGEVLALKLTAGLSMFAHITIPARLEGQKIPVESPAFCEVKLSPEVTRRLTNNQ